jgi:hypothetical protein
MVLVPLLYLQSEEEQISKKEGDCCPYLEIVEEYSLIRRA